ncbi:hypothetical protein ZOSMA_70G00590 [Zostera marina]|uniref:Uncharacterized protein n=1 Tax=Zostera marina TaxID=29655 RepID=A0A0K9NSR7_ZOSMR|nr:hypothetical protein ZOSMA_70G00590 [Zostera marina]
MTRGPSGPLLWALLWAHDNFSCRALFWHEKWCWIL